MRLPGLESQAQRLSRPEQVLLADHLIRRLRAQLLGQRGETGLAIPQGDFLRGAVNRKIRRILRKQIVQGKVSYGGSNKPRFIPCSVPPPPAKPKSHTSGGEQYATPSLAPIPPDMSHPVKTHEGRNPMDIGLLGAYTVMPNAYRSPHLVQQSRRLRNRLIIDVRFH